MRRTFVLMCSICLGVLTSLYKLNLDISGNLRVARAALICLRHIVHSVRPRDENKHHVRKINTKNTPKSTLTQFGA